MATLDEKKPLMELISIKWRYCTTPRDFCDMQHFLDGIWAALTFQGEKGAAEEVQFLSDVAHELQYLIH
jgi:hypothetical protein